MRTNHGTGGKEQGTGDAASRLSQVCALAFLLGMMGGCGRGTQGSPPPTFSVTGEVQDASGNPLTKGLLVQFISESNPSLNISAPIKEGKFTLVTSFGNQTVSGTMEGRYRVKVIPAFARGLPVEVMLPDIYEIKPEINHLVLKLPQGTPK